jgi:hypothetical protein
MRRERPFDIDKAPPMPVSARTSSPISFNAAGNSRAPGFLRYAQWSTLEATVCVMFAKSTLYEGEHMAVLSHFPALDALRTVA